MFPNIEYETQTLSLQPEDIVVFASDGILESNAIPEKRDFLGWSDWRGCCGVWRRAARPKAFPTQFSKQPTHSAGSQRKLMTIER